MTTTTNAAINVNDITFGVEIETHIPSGALRVGSYRNGNQAVGLPAGWQAKSDCSIQSPVGRTGCEFVSPVLKGAEGIASVVAAIAAIEAMGAKVNASCGVHIHVGFDRTNEKALKRLISLVANFETAIYAATGTTSRENGRWCSSVKRHGNADNAKGAAGTNRYHVLNLTNLTTGRRPTVEFRAFSGSTNAAKIVSWIRLCVAMVERSLKAQRTASWDAKPVKSTSPIARKSGIGSTTLARLFYQLGWTKGRVAHTHGDLTAEGAVDLKETKRTLQKLARKYDAQKKSEAA